jgi:tripartite-type tricarboxylate transporter receptor subunit TctC
MNTRRSHIVGLLLGLLASSASWSQGPAGYPNKPIRMIVPLAAGSAVDNAARIVAQKMGQNIGQSIVIENQPGAAGLIGTERVAKSPPDGYTLGGFNDSIMTMLPNLQARMPWDILRDFEPVSLVATVEWGLVVPIDAPQHSAADLIASARKAPGQVNYGSGGNGSPQHIAMALFASQAGVSMTHVPYKGATQAAMGVAGKEVHTAFQGIATVNSLINAACRSFPRCPPSPSRACPASNSIPGSH